MSEVMGTLYQSIVEMKELSMGFDQKNNIVDTISGNLFYLNCGYHRDRV